MGAAYFIVLDNKEPGFDPFVNGKAFSREAKHLSKIARSLGLKTPDEYFSVGGEEAKAMAEEFGVEDEVNVPLEQWFDVAEGLAWVRHLRAHVQANSTSVQDAQAVLSDLAEFEQVLLKAKEIGAKWHLSVDF